MGIVRLADLHREVDQAVVPRHARRVDGHRVARDDDWNSFGHACGVGGSAQVLGLPPPCPGFEPDSLRHLRHCVAVDPKGVIEGDVAAAGQSQTVKRTSPLPGLGETVALTWKTVLTVPLEGVIESEVAVCVAAAAETGTATDADRAKRIATAARNAGVAGIFPLNSADGINLPPPARGCYPSARRLQRPFGLFPIGLSLALLTSVS